MARKKSVETSGEKKVRKVAKGGKSRGKRKLTDDQVLAIVAAYGGGNNGKTMAAIAAEYGVANPTISSIVNGRTYSWLTKIGLEPLAEAA